MRRLGFRLRPECPAAAFPAAARPVGLLAMAALRGAALCFRREGLAAALAARAIRLRLGDAVDSLRVGAVADHDDVVEHGESPLGFTAGVSRLPGALLPQRFAAAGLPSPAAVPAGRRSTDP